jgi:hypothetical protein
MKSSVTHIQQCTKVDILFDSRAKYSHTSADYIIRQVITVYHVIVATLKKYGPFLEP